MARLLSLSCGGKRNASAFVACILDWDFIGYSSKLGYINL
jgi:hypothetical protein